MYKLYNSDKNFADEVPEQWYSAHWHDKECEHNLSKWERDYQRKRWDSELSGWTLPFDRE